MAETRDGVAKLCTGFNNVLKRDRQLARQWIYDDHCKAAIRKLDGAGGTVVVLVAVVVVVVVATSVVATVALLLMLELVWVLRRRAREGSRGWDVKSNGRGRQRRDRHGGGRRLRKCQSTK